MAESDSIEYRGVKPASSALRAMAERVQRQIEEDGQRACDARDRIYAELEAKEAFPSMLVRTGLTKEEEGHE